MASFSAELVASTPLSPRVLGMVFRTREPFARAAGQHVWLTLPDGSSYAFSLASPFSEQDPGRFEIAAQRGTTAEALLALAPGSVVSVSGPSGSLVWQGDAPSLLVATGTGVSPLRAIVLEQLERASSAPITLLFGCRDESEELWGGQLRELSRRHARFRYVVMHSQPGGADVERRGRVQERLPELARELGRGLHAYLCGHTPMVSDCTRLLVEQGVPPEHVHSESY